MGPRGGRTAQRLTDQLLGLLLVQQLLPAQLPEQCGQARVDSSSNIEARIVAHGGLPTMRKTVRQRTNVKPRSNWEPLTATNDQPTLALSPSGRHADPSIGTVETRTRRCYAT